MESTTLVIFSCLILLNVVFIIWVSVHDCKDKARLKALKAANKKHAEEMQVRVKEKASQSSGIKARLHPIEEEPEGSESVRSKKDKRPNEKRAVIEEEEKEPKSQNIAHILGDVERLNVIKRSASDDKDVVKEN